jgi:hypothetical protein
MRYQLVLGQLQIDRVTHRSCVSVTFQVAFEPILTSGARDLMCEQGSIGQVTNYTIDAIYHDICRISESAFGLRCSLLWFFTPSL